MKKLLKISILILAGILLLCLSVQAQEQPQYIGTPKSAVHIQGRLYVDSLLILPYTDTMHISPPIREGAFMYENSDRKLYYYKGSYWEKVPVYADTTNMLKPYLLASDTAYLSKRINDNVANIAANVAAIDTKLNKSDTTAKWLPLTGGTLSGPAYYSGSIGSSNQLVNRNYVDNLVTGLSWKQAVQAVTTTNIVLSGLQTIDGYSAQIGDRILVKNQTDSTLNGIYLADTSAWVRASDNSSGTQILGSATYAINGIVNKQTQWANSNTGTITVGATKITYGQIAGSGTYTNGSGIDLNANMFSLNTPYARGLFTGSSTTGINYNNSTGAFSLGSIPNTSLANSTISGVALGGTLLSLTPGTHLTGGSYNGSATATLGTDATSSNAPSTIVSRDASGNFTAGTITAATYNGNAAGLTGIASSLSIGGGANHVGNTLLADSLGYGAASGSSYNGSSQMIVSWNTLGVPRRSGQGAYGTWPISITGTASGETLATVTGRGSTTTNTITSAGFLSNGGGSNGWNIFQGNTTGNNPVGLTNGIAFGWNNINGGGYGDVSVLWRSNAGTTPYFRIARWDGTLRHEDIWVDASDNVGIANNITATKFIVNGGTSSQFLKANGSVDGSTYMTSNLATGNLIQSGSNRSYLIGYDTLNFSGNNGMDGSYLSFSRYLNKSPYFTLGVSNVNMGGNTNLTVDSSGVSISTPSGGTTKFSANGSVKIPFYSNTDSSAILSTYANGELVLTHILKHILLINNNYTTGPSYNTFIHTLGGTVNFNFGSTLPNGYQAVVINNSTTDSINIEQATGYTLSTGGTVYVLGPKASSSSLSTEVHLLYYDGILYITN